MVPLASWCLLIFLVEPALVCIDSLTRLHNELAKQENSLQIDPESELSGGLCAGKILREDGGGCFQSTNGPIFLMRMTLQLQFTASLSSPPAHAAQTLSGGVWCPRRRWHS